MAQGPRPRPARSSLTSTICCLISVCLWQCPAHHEYTAVRSSRQHDHYHLGKKGASQQSWGTEQTPGKAGI